MKDNIKTLLCFIIVVACVIIYIAFCCLPTIDELIDKHNAKKYQNQIQQECSHA